MAGMPLSAAPMRAAHRARCMARSSPSAAACCSRSTITAERRQEWAMQALVTGFEPFGGDAVNPAFAALGLLPPRLGALAVATRVLPTVFGRARAALDGAIAATAPDIVLCLGLAGGRAALSLERVAINLDDACIPDNDGVQPIDRAIVTGGPPAYFTTLPMKAAA